MLRLFVAIDIPETIQRYLGDAIDTCRDVIQGAKWVDPGNLHLTLKFLGNVEEERLPAVEDALRSAVGGGALRLSLGEAGVFPGPKRARVFWIGLEGDLPGLQRLARSIDLAMRKLRFEKEKRAFAAHVTLARLRQPGDASALLACWDDLKESADKELLVREVLLYRSVLGSTGPTYTALARLPLG
jgi:2'-5' RNA ligase